jgi:hypothetical protein
VESNDLSESNPEKVEALKIKFNEWAKEVGNIEVL